MELANYLFMRELKVTSRNVADAVKAVRAAKKQPSERESLINALIADEIQKMTSLVDELPELEAAKPIEIVDTASWANDLLDD